MLCRLEVGEVKRKGAVKGDGGVLTVSPFLLEHLKKVCGPPSSLDGTATRNPVSLSLDLSSTLLTFLHYVRGEVCEETICAGLLGGWLTLKK